jgi:hypothetical protein
MGRHKKIWVTSVAAAFGVLLVAVSAVAGAAPTRSAGPPGDSPVAQDLRQIERSRLAALVDADMAVVEALHADHFQLVPPPGFELSRDDYLEAVASGDIDYLRFEPISDITVHLYGDAAALTYKSNIDIVVAGLGRFTHDTWHTYIYEKRQGNWQAVWEQATAIGGFPPP